MQRVLTTVTLLGLLVATAAAFAITERLKLTKSSVYGTQVSRYLAPGCQCATSKATVRIKLRHTGHVTVTIANSAGHEIATIGSDVLMRAGVPKAFPWDGRTDAGVMAPDGVYYPWVHLPRRTLRFLNRITLDTKAPKVLSASLGKPVLFAGPGNTIAIKYTLSEKAHAVVYLGRHRIIQSRLRHERDKVKWAGTLAGSPLPAGTYDLSVAAEDLAGNVTPAAERKHVSVVVRYIQLAPERITAHSGRRFAVHVQTAAARYTWRLGRRHGRHRGKVLHLQAPTTPGTYRLVVSEDGHTTTAVVRVRGK